MEAFGQLYHCAFRFFYPIEGFLDRLIARFPDAVFVDCGCGLGDTTLEIREAGGKCLALDLNPSENANLPVNEIIPISAPEFTPCKGMVMLLIRPNRGWWIHQTIDKAMECGVPVVYISKPCHEQEDILPLPYPWERWEENIGAEGETAFIIGGVPNVAK